MGLSSCIADNFHGGGANFRYFRDCFNSHEIYIPQKFATVGKGRLVKVAASVRSIVVKRIVSVSNLLSVCNRRTQYETGRSLFLLLR